MDLGIRNKTALVAASSKGLGRAVAEELAAEGCKLILCARGEDALMQTRDELAAAGATAHAITADLSEPADIERVVSEGRAALGPIHILVTNTGGPPAGSFESHSAEVWQQAVRQNLDSVVNLVRAVLPDMKTAGWGRIVNITSLAVKQPVDGLILSNSLRAAVTGFARTLANEVAPLGITVNNAMPGYTRTERLTQLAEKLGADAGISADAATAAWEQAVPMARIGEPAEFAALVAFLVSARASYITGSSIAVDGGCVRSLL